MTFNIPENSLLARYLCAIVLGALATTLQWGIHPLVGPRIPFLFSLPALILTATLAGRSPALIVLLIGIVNGIFLLEVPKNLAISHTGDYLALLAYFGIGLMLVMVGSRVRLITRRAAEAEQQLALAQENTGVGLYEIDLVRRTIFPSITLYKLLGRKPAGRYRRGYIPLDVWNAAFRNEELKQASAVFLHKVRDGVNDYEYEHRVTLPDGEVRWLMSRVHIERDGKDNAIRLRGASVDITDRKKINALLDQTQSELTQQVDDLQRLHELSSRLPELPDLRSQLQAILQALAGFHASSQGTVSLVNQEKDSLILETSLGLEEHIVAQLTQVPKGAGSCGQAFAQARRIIIEDTETDPCFAEYRQLARDADFRAIHSTPLLSLAGEVMGVLSVHLKDPGAPDPRAIRLADICARKAAVFIEHARAQQLAKQSDQRFQIALDASAVPFAIFVPVRDEDGIIVEFRWSYVNTAFTKILKRAPQELLGHCAGEMYPGFWAGNELFEHYVRVVENNETREFEMKASRTNEGWFHIIASPLHGSVAVWSANITERKLQQKALQEADRRKDEFLATLAHELRNPLAPIRQATIISKMPNASDAQKRWSLDVIERQVKHMALLLDDLLDVSRITRGALQLRKKPTELAAVVEAAVETARPLMESKQQRLSIELPSQPVMFDADQLRVAQVLTNLLMNAAKYTDAGGAIALRAELAADDLRIRIIDNGVGIKPETLSDIFRMFTQVRATQDRSNGGLGIGLALAKGLVELHGGSISAHSAGLGHGSEFCVRLPLGIAATAWPQAVREGGEQAQPVCRKVLIADDNCDAADSLAVLLRMEGHEVRIAFDGASALQVFAEFQPEVALLDIGMPKLRGTDVAREIRRTETDRKTMLIAITGWGQEKDRHQALTAGFNHHLTKPVDPAHLRDLLAMDASALPVAMPVLASMPDSTPHSSPALRLNA